MELICPDCRGTLEMQSVVWAVCAQHGGRYQVLFDRYALPRKTAPGTQAIPQPEGAVCAAHPKQAAVSGCGTCGKSLCSLCSFEVAGRVYCSDCAAGQAGGATTAAVLRRAPANLGQCADHVDVPAVARCKLCAKTICATCDFALPGGVHVCPSCIDSQSVSDEVSPKRKRLSYISLALAAWSTFFIILLFTGVFNESLNDPDTAKVADLIVTNLILWPLIVGLGLGLSALDKKLKNTMLMKAAAWWNGILGAIFLLIVIAANIGLIK